VSPVAWYFFVDARTSDLERDVLRYSRYGHDGRIYAKLLHLQNGDSLASVAALLGNPHEDYQPNPSELVHVYRKVMNEKPAHDPGGVEDDDSFLEFSCVSLGGIWLQFRDDKLVNHDPEKFRHLVELSRI
jgi:hypothetical protein